MIPSSRLRTLGIVAHIDAGKTTLTEHILFDAGMQRFCGDVDEGTATMDWMRQEQERGISIAAAATRVPWEDCLLQIVDTPGHVDFTAEVERCMRVLDSVVVVVDSIRGVESQTETVWRKADEWRCARLVFVNKMDRRGADFTSCLETLRKRLDCRPVPVVVPLADAEGRFAGLGDPIRGSAVWFDGEVPAELQQRFAEQLRGAREVVLEAAADVDDAVMASYVAGEDISAERIVAALRRGCIEARLVPVLCGAALHDQGVDWLLDAICDFLPSPVDRDRRGLEVAFPSADPDAPMSALVFKRERSGDDVRSHVRVFQGILRSGDELAVDGSAETVRVGEIWSVHAAHHEVVAAGVPGEILALPGLVHLRTGQTLSAAGGLKSLPMPRFSPPVLGAVFEPATEQDEAPLQQALSDLVEDDPTLSLETDAQSGLPLLFGMGELHLEVVAERVRERRTCAFSVSRPRVALRATVAGSGEGAATAQAPGMGGVRSVEAVVRVSPLVPSVGPAAAEVGAAAEVVDVRVETKDGVQGLSPGVVVGLLEGLGQAARSGTMLGQPAQAVQIDVLGVSAKDGEGALAEQALMLAVQRAVESAGRRLLEPGVEFEVRCPEEHASAVLADLAARGASMTLVSSGQVGAWLQGRGKLAAFLGYATRLRSVTQGRGEVQLRPASYEPAE